MNGVAQAGMHITSSNVMSLTIDCDVNRRLNTAAVTNAGLRLR